MERELAIKSLTLRKVFVWLHACKQNQFKTGRVNNGLGILADNKYNLPLHNLLGSVGISVVPSGD